VSAVSVITLDDETMFSLNAFFQTVSRLGPNASQAIIEIAMPIKTANLIKKFFRIINTPI